MGPSGVTHSVAVVIQSSPVFVSCVRSTKKLFPYLSFTYSAVQHSALCVDGINSQVKKRGEVKQDRLAVVGSGKYFMEFTAMKQPWNLYKVATVK